MPTKEEKMAKAIVDGLKPKNLKAKKGGVNFECSVSYHYKRTDYFYEVSDHYYWLHPTLEEARARGNKAYYLSYAGNLGKAVSQRNLKVGHVLVHDPAVYEIRILGTITKRED